MRADAAPRILLLSEGVSNKTIQHRCRSIMAIIRKLSVMIRFTRDLV